MKAREIAILPDVNRERSLLADYAVLSKLRLSLMVVFTACAAYVISAGAAFDWLNLLFLAIGGLCITVASNAINQVLEKDFDKLMKRTSQRPIVTGRIVMSHGVLFAGMMCVLGVSFLGLINGMTAFFGMLSFVIYSFVYTPLKRYSSVAVTIGAISGAMPLLIGSVAWFGGVTWLGLILFGIQFAWQYPHFWAIGHLGYKDYKKAGYAFIPGNEDEPARIIGASSVIFCVVLVALGFLLYMLNFLTIGVAIFLSIINVIFLVYGIKYQRAFDLLTAKRLMFMSLLYVPIVYIVMVVQSVVSWI